jgi:diguanylate cyclase (GGDEF)-like protein
VCRAAFVSSAVWVVGYAASIRLVSGSAAGALFVGDIVYLVPIAGGVVAATVAAVRTVGRHRTMWRLLTAAYSAQLGGEAVWATYDYLAKDGPPQPSLADVGYLSASLLTVAAVLVGFGGAGGLRHLRGLLDSALIVVSLGAPAWQLLIRPQLTEQVVVADLVNVAYPLLDVVLLACLGIVGIAGHRFVPLSVLLVGLAGGLNACNDMVYTSLNIFSVYRSGSWLDVSYETGAVCSLLAAVVAVRRPERPAQRRSFDRGLVLLPILVATAAAALLVGFDKVRSGVVSDFTLVVVGVLFLAVLLRQYLFAADRTRLADELRQAADRLRQAAAEQHRLAITDGLTGLYNRRHLTSQLSELHTGTDESDGRGSVSLMVVDLDHFKRVNDTFGHPAGDAVLQEAAARITAASRGSDVVARYGGEEFVVLLPQTGQPEALQVAERVRQRLRGESFDAGGMPVAVTASIGVATSGRADVGHLMEAADRLLYRAKAEGRDRVVAAVWPNGVAEAAEPSGRTAPVVLHSVPRESA